MSASPLYTAIMFAAPAAAMIAAKFAPVQPLPLPRRQKLGVALGAFCGAMITAKTPYVLVESWQQPGFGAWLQDGKTILLGMVGGYFGVELAKHMMGIRLKTGDNFAFPAAVGIAVGRLGCFYGGCCFGTPTSVPWARRFHDAIPRHPTQIYEFTFHAVMAVTLFILAKRQIFRGNLIKLYFLLYFAFRFATEYIRPEARHWLNLTLYQWTALIAAPVFVLLWLKDARGVVPLEKELQPQI